MQGLRQGMPESPLLFASVLNDVMNMFDQDPCDAEDQPLTKIFAYLDEFNAFVTRVTLRYWIACFQGTAAKHAGLHLNLGKSGVWWPQNPPHADLMLYRRYERKSGA